MTINISHHTHRRLLESLAKKINIYKILFRYCIAYIYIYININYDDTVINTNILKIICNNYFNFVYNSNQQSYKPTNGASKHYKRRRRNSKWPIFIFRMAVIASVCKQ